MAIGKRLRFEILRRDNHACRYCGATAPAVRLVVDHVVPEALGGRSEPENLVAACEPCNSGKSSVHPDAQVVADVKQDALRWARAIAAAAQVQEAELLEEDKYVKFFYEETNVWTPRGGDAICWPDDWEQTIRAFRRYGLSSHSLLDAYRRADAARQVRSDAAWKYFCGICWSRIRELRMMAERTLAAEEA